jgi:hypothetical protein
MSKQFVNAMGWLTLIALLVSACQSSPAVIVLAMMVNIIRYPEAIRTHFAFVIHIRVYIIHSHIFFSNLIEI